MKLSIGEVAEFVIESEDTRWSTVVLYQGITQKDTACFDAHIVKTRILEKFANGMLGTNTLYDKRFQLFLPCGAADQKSSTILNDLIMKAKLDPATNEIDIDVTAKAAANA